MRDLWEGIKYPDRWGHFKRGHLFAQYYKAQIRLDRQYTRIILNQLDHLWPPDDPREAPARTPRQRLAFAAYLHNFEALNRAVDDLIDEAVNEALKPFQPVPHRPGRPPTKRRYRSTRDPLNLKDLCQFEEV